MKILAFSDLHRNADTARILVEASRKADVVVGAGDFASFGRGLADTLDVLGDLAVPFILVAGNHERVEHLQDFATRHPQWHVLHGTAVTLSEVTFFGFGYAVEPNASGQHHTVLSDEQATPALQRLPADAVFITHAPPFGAGDLDVDGTRRGSHAIRRTIEAKQPRLHLCGHIHHAWGTSARIGRTPTHNLGPTVNWFDA